MLFSFVLFLKSLISDLMYLSSISNRFCLRWHCLPGPALSVFLSPWTGSMARVTDACLHCLFLLSFIGFLLGQRDRVEWKGVLRRGAPCLLVSPIFLNLIWKEWHFSKQCYLIKVFSPKLQRTNLWLFVALEGKGLPPGTNSLRVQWNWSKTSARTGWVKGFHVSELVRFTSQCLHHPSPRAAASALSSHPPLLAETPWTGLWWLLGPRPIRYQEGSGGKNDCVCLHPFAHIEQTLCRGKHPVSM